MMDDWDSVSNTTPPHSATDPSDAVSTPQPPQGYPQQQLTPSPPNVQPRRALPPDNLVIPDASQPDSSPDEGISTMQPLQASPPQDNSATSFDQTDMVTSAFPHRSRTPVPAPPVKRTARFIVFIGIALVLALGGLGLFQAVNIHTANESATATATATASAIQANATATASIIPSPPTITSVSQFLPVQNQEIIISGKGFGEQAAFTDTTSNYLRIEDITNGDWTAGWGKDWVTVSVSVWTDNQIVITGFSGSYGTYGWVFHTGDTVVISVWNVQSGAGGAGQAQFSLVVAG